jgi:hypothetical protein
MGTIINPYDQSPGILAGCNGESILNGTFCGLILADINLDSGEYLGRRVDDGAGGNRGHGRH